MSRAHSCSSAPQARFGEDGMRFTYTGNHGWAGAYNLHWQEAEANHEKFLGAEHPLAQEIMQRALSRSVPPLSLSLHYRAYGKRIAMLEPFIGRSGWVCASKLTAQSFDKEEFVLLAGTREDGMALSEDHCRKLLALPAMVVGVANGDAPEQLGAAMQERAAVRLSESEARNGQYLNEEQSKLDRWAEDLKLGLEGEIRELDKAIREARRTGTASTRLEDKLAAQKQVKGLESARNRKRRELFEAQDGIDRQRDELIGQMEKQMKSRHETKPLFAFQWTLVE